MRSIRLNKTGAFLRRSPSISIQSACISQDSIHRRWADGHNVIIQHHERQPTITVQWMAIVIVENGLPFPVFEPEIAGDLAIVLVGFSVAILPRMELACAQFQPAQQLFGGQFGAVGPVADVIYNFVASIVGNPNAFQSSPISFFVRTLASISSAMTSFLLTSFASRCCGGP